MKVFFSYIVPLLAGVMLLSCVNDDGLFMDSQQANTPTSSIALVAFLEVLKQSQEVQETGLCFRFEYPITIAYSSGTTITVQDFNGFKQLMRTQTSALHASAISYPFEIIDEDSTGATVIGNEADFIGLLMKCELPTFRTLLDVFSGECFDVRYPITIIANDNTATPITNENEYTRFIATKSSTYQPLFEFPMFLVLHSTEERVVVDSYFDFYQLFPTCQVNCPTLGFSRDGEFLYAEVGIQDDAVVLWSGTYGWFVNDVLLETEDTNARTDHKFGLSQLDPGTYKICVKTINDDCTNESLFCEEIIIATQTICPTLEFDFERRAGGAIFFAEPTEVTYTWFIDNEFKENDGGATGDNEFFFQFEPGTYEICMRTETPICPNGISFCKTLVFNDSCPELSFVIEELSTGNYKGIADFDSKSEIQYAWYIDNELQEIDGGRSGDNFIIRELQAGTYEICIKEEVSGCPELNTFCETLIVP